MAIEKYIISLPLLRRTASDGHLSMCVVHKNETVPSFLNKRRRLKINRKISLTAKVGELIGC